MVCGSGKFKESSLDDRKSRRLGPVDRCRFLSGWPCRRVRASAMKLKITSSDTLIVINLVDVKRHMQPTRRNTHAFQTKSGAKSRAYQFFICRFLSKSLPRASERWAGRRIKDNESFVQLKVKYFHFPVPI